MKYEVHEFIYRFFAVLLWTVICCNAYSDNIVVNPDIPVTPHDPFDPSIVNSKIDLRSGDTQTVSLLNYYNITDESKSVRDIIVRDTLAVRFDCLEYEFCVGMPLVTPPETPEIYVSINRMDNGISKLYGHFSWNATKQPNGNYVINNSGEENLLVLFPGSYQIVYGVPIHIVSPSEINLKNEISNDSSDVRFKTSVMSVTYSAIIVSMKCSDVDPEMIVRVPPSPDISNTNYGLGSAFGEYGVSDSGAAIYDLVIEVPKYRFTPKLGISYSSHMLGYGLVGYSINISGISVITRTGKNDFYDKDYKGITYTDEDNYLLDGKRLIPSDLGNENCRNYSIEGNPFSSVVKNSSNGQVWFTVFDNGTIYEYGKDPSSINKFINKNGTERISEWYISSATDANWNYMTYHYEKSDMLIYPTLITYGLNRFIPGGECSTITFEYGDLGANKRSFMIDGQQGYINKCLKTITTGTDGLIYRKYLLSYDTSSDQANIKFTKLKSVLVQNGAGGSLSPIEFTWNSLSGNIQAYNLRNEIPFSELDATQHDAAFLSADLNTDGISDIIKFSQVSINQQGNIGAATYMYISLSKKENNGNISYEKPLKYTIPAIFTGDKNMLYVPFNTPSIIDIDGDGYNDFVFTYMSGSNNLYWIIWGKDIIAGYTNRKEGLEISVKSSSIYTIADFDGDGKDEIIYIDTKDYNGIYSSGLIDYGNRLEAIRDMYAFQLPSSPENIFSADYNNDGLTDLIFFYKNGYTIYYNNGGLEKSGLYTEDNKSVSTIFGNKIRMNQGDFNGDGLIDFVYYEKSIKKLVIAKNNGDGSFSIDYSDAIGINIEEMSQDQSLIVCDFDHDGYADVLVAGKNSNKIKTQWFYSDGVTLRLKSEYNTVNSDKSIKVRNSIFIGDFDGDGSEELANFGAQLNAEANGYSVKKFYTYRSSSKAYEEGRVRSISDGIGHCVSFRYSSLTNPTVYSMVKSMYPIKSYSMPMSIVCTSYENHGEHGQEQINYKYNTLKYHVSGRGCLGFSSVSKENLAKGIKEVLEISKLDSKWYTPIESKSITIINTDTAKTIVSNYVDIINYNYIVRPKTEETIDFDGNKSITQYSYDYDTNLLKTKKIIYGLGEDMYKSISYDNYICVGNTKWVPEKIVNTMKHSDDTNTYKTKTSLQYDLNGNIISKIENDGTELKLTTSYTYDDWGNVLSIVKTGKGVTPVTKYFEYDINGRFLKRSFSLPLSATISYSYDRWGSLLLETDETDSGNNLVRMIEYDSWGRKIAEMAPDGTKTTYKYGWGVTDEYRYFTSVFNSDGGIETKWFDSMGRERLVKTIGVGGIQIAKLSHYNKEGQISHIESYLGKLVLDKTYSYDNRGRVNSIYDVGRSISYRYENRKTIKNVNGRQYSSIKDAWGNLVETRDPLSIISYTYSSNGKPSKIATEDGSITIEYDAAGNRIQLSDTDTGKNFYIYAADGTLLSHTDARGVTTEYEVDFLGRIIKIKTGDRIVTNTYGSEGYSLQRISRRSDGNNHIDYTYDRYGRLIKERRTVGKKGIFDYEFGYNNYGQLSKVMYPGGLEVCYEYDTYGNRIKIEAGGYEIWSFKSNDGKIITSSAIGVFDHVYSVDDYGYISDIEVVKFQSDDKDDILNEYIHLEHDVANGNLISRQDGYGLPRVYEYDEMDRLMSVSTAEKEILSMQYADNGNILSKSNVGDYDYDAVQPHAVSKINNIRGAVPTATQIVRFNDIGKIASITEMSREMVFDYGPDGQLWYSLLTDSTKIVRENVYSGNYEKIIENNITREFYYLDGNVIIIKEDGYFNPYFAFADERGSIVSVFDKSGSAVFSASYDEWGYQNVTKNTIGLYRGYTSHEMIPEFGVINMNGRMYDPVLARFLSPDNYVQEPTTSQNFNRYSYCLNNPLKYTDPTGEWFGIDDLLVSGVGFLTGYISNGFKTGNWGIRSVQAGFCSATMSYLGFNSIGVLSGKVSVSKYLIGMCISSMANTFIPSMSIPITSNMGFSMSPMFGWGEYGLSYGLSACLNFNFGDGWNFSISEGIGNQYYGGNFSFSYKKWGAGYGLTHYYEQNIGAVNYAGEQNVGTISALLGGVSLRISNDLFGDHHDRWRSSAVEIGYKNFVLGTYVTNNNGKKESEDYQKLNEKKESIEIDIKGNKQWTKGESFSAPFWIGYKSGNQIYRFGFSHPFIQDKTQNMIHKTLAPTPLFKGYSSFAYGIYVYSGYDSPYSLW